MLKIKFRNVERIPNNMNSKNKKRKFSDKSYFLILILKKISKRCSIILGIVRA